MEQARRLLFSLFSRFDSTGKKQMPAIRAGEAKTRAEPKKIEAFKNRS